MIQYERSPNIRKWVPPDITRVIPKKCVTDQDLESTDIGPADLIHDIATEAQKDLEEAAAPQTEITADGGCVLLWIRSIPVNNSLAS